MEQLIRYPAVIIMGRVTKDGILVIDDAHHLVDDADAASRLTKYMKLEELGGMKYRYEFAAVSDIKSVKEKMRQELEQEAEAQGHGNEQGSS